MEPDETLSESVAGKLCELFRWLPLVLTTLFVALLAFTHFFYAGMKANLGPKGYRVMNIETERANAAWNWVNAHLIVSLAYCALLLAVSLYLGKARHKLWVAALFVALLLPALWYWSEAAYLGGKFMSY